MPTPKPIVLLVEDNPDVHKILDLELGVLWNIPNVHSLAAMRTYLSSGVKVDCIILDLSLPDSKRESTMEAVQSLAPHIPVVVYTREGTAPEAFAQGAQDFILKGEKDISFDIIIRAVQYAIERHKYRGTFIKATEAIDCLKELAQKTLDNTNE